MEPEEVGRLWEGNAEAWTRLSRAGYDVYRDGFNTPAFLEMLPDVRGLRGLDVGCGEGHNTRLVAARGARMSAFDIAPTFVEHARAREREGPLGIEYRVASAHAMPYEDGSFDFATAFMSLMDMPGVDRALAEARRVVRPGGFLQFSITHPCFDVGHRREVKDETGRTRAIEVGGYFDPPTGEVEEWTYGAAPEEAKAKWGAFRVPRFCMTLSGWINLLVETGFEVERIGEPRPSESAVEREPRLHDARVVAYFLHVRARRR